MLASRVYLNRHGAVGWSAALRSRNCEYSWVQIQRILFFTLDGSWRIVHLVKRIVEHRMHGKYQGWLVSPGYFVTLS